MITLPATDIVHCINCQHYVPETGGCDVTFQGDDNTIMDWLVSGEGATPSTAPVALNSARTERVSVETGHCKVSGDNFLAIESS